MNRILIIITAVVALGLIALNISPANRADALEVTAQTNEVTQTFAVENMTCPACPFTVKKAMARVEGVKSVIVNFDAKTATAIFDSAVTTAEDIAAASANVGYPSTPIDGTRITENMGD